MQRNEVYKIIDEERDYQDNKWGKIEDNPKETGSWLTIMRYCLSQAEAKYSTNNTDHYGLDEIRKLVATGIACLEQHGAISRTEAKNCFIKKNININSCFKEIELSNEECDEIDKISKKSDK